MEYECGTRMVKDVVCRGYGCEMVVVWMWLGCGMEGWYGGGMVWYADLLHKKLQHL